MRVLIAEDDNVSRRMLERFLSAAGHDVLSVSDGTEAWSVLKNAEAPPLAILDWQMPGIDGIEICRRVRRIQTGAPIYLMLLTAKGSKRDIVEGLNAGANDYIVKPFNRDELRARVQVGEAVVGLQHRLQARVDELEDALAQIKHLQGMLPICSYCKNIRDDQNYWHQIESYITSHSDAQFSHSICPGCYDRHVLPQILDFKRKRS